MKKTILTMALAIISMVFVACGDGDTPDGKWNAMQWEDVTYASQTINNTNYYIVPQEGGTYTFVCKNYTPAQVTSLSRYKIDETLNPSTFASVSQNGKTVTVTIAPNDTITRYAILEVMCGDAGCAINFVQEGAR